MTNTGTKGGIVFVFAILIGLAGCKKEETPSALFELTDASSVHFDYAQEKKVGFKIREVQKVSVGSELPKGWECFVEGREFVITSPAKGADATWSGSITVTAKTNNGGELTNKISVAVKESEIFAAPANCFIASKPGQRYMFDATIKGNKPSETISPASAKLLWVTAKGGVGHVSLEDGNIYFATADEETLTEANALVAALDDDDNILWSWHIWCTDLDLTVDAVEFGGMTVMNRNLGAFDTSDASAEEALASYGLLYQWGRKDPFVSGKEWDSTTQYPMYDAKDKYVEFSAEETSATIGKIEYATANPTVFIKGTKDSDFDWLFAARNNTLWGNAYTGTSGVTAEKGTKSIYDPCPAGWMVAPPKTWASFTEDGETASDPDKFNVEKGYEYGWTFTAGEGGIYFPAAGRRGFTSGNISNVIKDEFSDPEVQGDPVGFYWSNSNSASNGAFLAFRKDYINPDSTIPEPEEEEEEIDRAYGARAGGFSVRCVKE